MAKLRIMSQNQWNYTLNNDYWKEKGLDCSSLVRMKGHTKVFRDIMPDIVGGQEVNKDMQLDFMADLIDDGNPYTLIWGNMTPIFYKAEKLELLAHDFLRYPETVEGYEGYFNDSFSKNANLAVFREKESGKVFIFVTTHLWWMNGEDPESVWYRAGSCEVRKMQIAMAIDLIEKYQKIYGECPVFLVGDLNDHYNSLAVQYAMKERGFLHAHNVATEYASEDNGYCATFRDSIGAWEHRPFEDAIDHILVRNLGDVEVKRFDRYMTDEYIYLSDHAPVFVDVEM